MILCPLVSKEVIVIFYGNNFIFDGIHSETFDLKIGYLDNGVKENELGSNATIISDKIRRNPIPLFYGVEIEPVLSFNMLVYREIALDAYDKSAINKFLFGRQQYKWFQIQQEDGMEGIWYNCLLTNPQDVFIGGVAYCKKFTVLCDAPWAWTDEFTYNYNLTNVNTNITFNNLSDVEDYLYPKLQCTLNSTTTGFSIKNTTDNNREFKFTGLQGGESITIDNNTKIITSNKGLNRLGNFNKNWFRLLPEFNSLVVTGQGSLKIMARFPRKVGA